MLKSDLKRRRGGGGQQGELQVSAIKGKDVCGSIKRIEKGSAATAN